MIVGLARTHDRLAFEELLRRYQSWIRHLLYQFCGHAELADDLAQDVFLMAWRKIVVLRDPNLFRAWLKRIAVTTWLEHLRRRDPLRLSETMEETGHNETPGTRMDLDRALACLPITVRLCIVLAYQENMTHQEIAELTGQPLGTVKSHIRRGTQRLQQTLADYTTESTNG